MTSSAYSSLRRLYKMAAPMTYNVSLNRKTLKYVILGHILSSISLFCLTYVSLNGFSQLDIISHPLHCMKLLAASCLIIHGCLHFCFGASSWQKSRLSLWIKVWCIMLLNVHLRMCHNQTFT